MLSDRELELLTSFLDGEQSARHRRQAERLLRESPEARALLADLQADSRHLLELPAVGAPVDLHRSVMVAIGKSKRKPVARPLPVRTFPAWTGWAAAAAVLLVIALGTFVSTSSKRGEDGVVVKKPKGEGEKEQGLVGGEVAKNVPQPERTPDRVPVRQPEDSKQPEPPVDDLPPVKPIEEQRDVLPPVVFGDGSREGSVTVERVQFALPTVFTLHGLDKEVGKLRERLSSGSAYRIELLTRNATSLPKNAPRAFDRISSALSGGKIGLVIDSTAQGNLKRPQFRHDYALFVENITPAELANLLAGVGAADSATTKKKGSEQRFDGSMVVKEMSAWDRKELVGMIGVDPVAVRPALPKKDEVDIRKPISEGTSKLVDEVLDGKRPARSESAGQSVLVLPLGGSRRESAEVKSYLHGRKPVTAGTVQALIVLRTLP